MPYLNIPISIIFSLLVYQFLLRWLYLKKQPFHAQGALGAAIHSAFYLVVLLLLLPNVTAFSELLVCLTACFAFLFAYLPESKRRGFAGSWFSPGLLFLSWLAMASALSTPSFNSRLWLVVAACAALLAIFIEAAGEQGVRLRFLRFRYLVLVTLLTGTSVGVIALGQDYWQNWLLRGAPGDELMLGISWAPIFALALFVLMGFLWGLWPFHFLWLNLQASPMRFYIPIFIAIRWFFLFALFPVVMALVSSQSDFFYKVMLWLSFSSLMSAFYSISQALVSRLIGGLYESSLSLLILTGLLLTQSSMWPLRQVLFTLTVVMVIHSTIFLCIRRFELIQPDCNKLIQDMSRLLTGKRFFIFSSLGVLLILMVFVSALCSFYLLSKFFTITHPGLAMFLALTIILSSYVFYRSIRRMIAYISQKQLIS